MTITLQREMIKVDIRLQSDFSKALKAASLRLPSDKEFVKMIKALDARLRSVSGSIMVSHGSQKKMETILKELNIFKLFLQSKEWSTVFTPKIINILLMNLEELCFEFSDRLSILQEYKAKSKSIQDLSKSFHIHLFKARGRGFVLDKKVLL